MAVVKRASGSWKFVVETLQGKGIKVEDLSKLPGMLNEQKKAFDETVKTFGKENADLKASFESAMTAFSIGHEAALLVIQEKFIQEIRKIDDELALKQKQTLEIGQKSILARLHSLKTMFDLWQTQNSLKSKKNKLVQQREKEIKSQNNLYESKKQKARKKNAEYQHEIESKVTRAKEGVDAIENMLKSGAYYGALSEVKMIDWLRKLPDNYYVINDVTMELDESVFFDDAWLSSAQIDHLVISPSGVFVVEVKNWSKKFSEEGNFFNPYQQVKRHNYVCYTLLNKTVRTTVRSIVAYAGHIPDKPDSSFAKVLPLEQVNGYILWFKDVNHDDTAMQKIVQIIEREIEYAKR